MRLFERAIRRAGLPVAMSEGYNPHPRLSLPVPLSTGMAGANEVLDVQFSRWMRPDEALSALQEQMPEGIGLNSVESTSPNPNRQPNELSYRVPLPAGHCVRPEQLDRLLQQDEAIVLRRRKKGNKEVEVRQFIRALRLQDDAVLMLLDYNQRGTARPEEVMEALGCEEGTDFLLGRIIRTNVSL
jgi:radical SAM-linked protein